MKKPRTSNSDYHPLRVPLQKCLQSKSKGLKDFLKKFKTPNEKKKKNYTILLIIIMKFLKLTYYDQTNEKLKDYTKTVQNQILNKQPLSQLDRAKLKVLQDLQPIYEQTKANFIKGLDKLYNLNCVQFYEALGEIVIYIKQFGLEDSEKFQTLLVQAQIQYIKKKEYLTVIQQIRWILNEKCDKKESGKHIRYKFQQLIQTAKKQREQIEQIMVNQQKVQSTIKLYISQQDECYQRLYGAGNQYYYHLISQNIWISNEQCTKKERDEHISQMDKKQREQIEQIMVNQQKVQSTIKLYISQQDECYQRLYGAGNQFSNISYDEAQSDVELNILLLNREGNLSDKYDDEYEQSERNIMSLLIDEANQSY